MSTSRRRQTRLSLVTAIVLTLALITAPAIAHHTSTGSGHSHSTHWHGSFQFVHYSGHHGTDCPDGRHHMYWNIYQNGGLVDIYHTHFNIGVC